MNLVQSTRTNPDYYVEWKACFDSLGALSPEMQGRIRRGVLDRLVAMNSPDHGISSSDRNHSTFSLWKRNGKDWDAVLVELLEENGS